MTSIRSLCPNCKHYITYHRDKENSYVVCKAFYQGVPIPYGDNYLWVHPYPVSNYEMDIRYHRILTPIQENNYLYEDKDTNNYDCLIDGQAIITLYDLYCNFHLWVYHRGMENLENLSYEKGLESIEKSFQKDNWLFLITSKEDAIEWIKSRNQSYEAKKILDNFFKYTAPFNKFFIEELEPDYIPETNDSFINRLFECIKEYGFPSDLCLPYNPIYAFYVYELLYFNFPIICSSLTEVIMQNKNIEILPDNVGELSNVRFLDISRNRLKFLPSSLGKLQYLERFDMCDNHIKILPDEFCNLTRMNRLDLYHNKLVSLPSQIGDLVNLQWLGLNHNHLSFFPDSVSDLQNLEGLYCTDNFFTIFPESVLQLLNLKYLYFSRNQISVLPLEIEHLKNLRWLGLGGNQLTHIPLTIQNLPSLEWLDLRGNPLVEGEIEKIKLLLPNAEILF